MSTINFDKSEDRPEEIVRQLIGVLKMAVGDADVVAHRDIEANRLEVSICRGERTYVIGFRLPLVLDTLRTEWRPAVHEESAPCCQ